MLTSVRLTLGVVLLSGTLSTTTPAFADACDIAVDAVNAHLSKDDSNQEDFNARLDKVKSLSEIQAIFCDFHREALNFWLDTLPLKERSEISCGDRLETGCDSACIRSKISQARADVAKTCAPKPSLEAKAPAGQQQRTKCNTGGSTITGLGDDKPNAQDRKHCNQADFALRSVRRMRRDHTITLKQSEIDKSYNDVIKVLRMAGDFEAAQAVEKEKRTPLPSRAAEDPVFGKKACDAMYRVAVEIINSTRDEPNSAERVSMLEHAASRCGDSAQDCRDAKDKKGEQRALLCKAKALELAATTAKTKQQPKAKSLSTEKCEALKKYIADLKLNAVDSSSIIKNLQKKLQESGNCK